MKWQDVILRVLVAALMALAGALTERVHPGVVSGLVVPPLAGAERLHVPVKSGLCLKPGSHLPCSAPAFPWGSA